MTFDPPLNVSFKSLIKDGKFWTLDESKEVFAPWYTRFIRKIDELSPVEVHYILIRYSNLNKGLEDVFRFIAKLKD